MPNSYSTIQSQDLASFYQIATQRGFSRDYQARVTNLVINGKELPQDDLIYIKEFSLPATKTTITSVKYLGVDIHSTALKDFGDSKNWGVTFHADEALTLKTWFEDRLTETASNAHGNTIFNPVSRDKTVNPVSGPGNYATLQVVNSNLEPLVEYTLQGLFIIDVPGINYNMAGDGKPQEFKITFGYQYWLVNPNTSGVTEYENAAAGRGGFGSTGGGAAGGGGGGFDIIQSTVGLLRGITAGANLVRGAATAVRGAATSVRGAGRAIRGR